MNQTTAVRSESCAIPCFKEALVSRMRAAMPDDEDLENACDLLGAIADRTRLRLLYALRKGEELCVCDVAHVLGISVSVASHHLRKLRDLRVLKYRNDGKMAYYSVRNPLAAELVERVLPSRRRRS